ncbi:M36 family metallopeptidase [Vitiosangium sp. GDMCC 1.1324]|uniref:M36 family metallopeptidase n=1 Tax=Vitiosangium sp. (strain GDMCC 1.1324) TaxID=2138576 RepID=UPI001E437390|nr:M36 family metallopeptidase [Vitiosangium sp. GDMCC 1.1324]
MPSGQYRKRLFHALVLMSTFAGPAALGAAPEPGNARNYDARVTYNAGLRQGFAPVQKTKEAELRRSIPELRVEVDETQGMVRSLTNAVGALSGPSSGDALTIGLDFVQRQRELLGLVPEDLANLEVTDRVYSKLNGVTHLYLRQVHKGVPVYNGQLQINVDKEGRVLSVHSDLQPGLAAALASVEPRVDAGQAVASVAKHLGVMLKTGLQVQKAEPGARQRTRVEAPGLSSESIDAQLSVLPVRRGEARLVWNFQVHTPDQQHDYDLTVDAQTGEVWTRVDWVASDDYRVYPRPVESPNHTTPLPPSDGRQLLLNPANTVASPYGWHDTNGAAGAEFTILRGNNVHAYEDSNNDGLPPATQPDCGATIHCDFPINLTGAPSTYIPAAVTNLFYWNNILHDVSYQYGFDEVGGNFQVNNYGHGALGNDDVRAEAQDGSGTNNANFSTPPDGSRPRMQMYVWTTVSPNKDGDLDTGIIAHEYTHGISNRLVGGPSNTSCLGNAQQPGEGLSDFMSLVLTARATDTGPMGRGVGTYALNQPTTGPGIRTQRYSTDPAINTWTYASINGMAVPHGVGSVFAQALWEAYWSLVDKYGYSSNLYAATGGAGNQRMLAYFIEGLKNTPCSPTFTQVRDGIITAASTLYGGQDVCRLWTSFAAFGLGSNAVSGGSGSTAPTNGFSVPASCKTDVWGKDKPWDTGLEPDAATAGNNMWESEDIWVRNDLTNGPHQNPEYGQTNYVHVKLRNRSTVEASNVAVKVYGTNAATSTSWPSLWTYIGEQNVVSLLGGADTEVSVPWNPPIVGHYCLMARMVTGQDPMTYAEIGDPNYNTRKNNNIIWRNTNVVNLVPFGFVDVHFTLRNVLKEPRLFLVRFREPEEQLKSPFLQRGAVVVDLGRELMAQWEKSGGKAEGVERVGETQFRIADPTRAYFGISLEPQQEFEVKMNFQDQKWTRETDKFLEYQFAVVQEDPQAQEENPAVGGVTYYLQASPLF